MIIGVAFAESIIKLMKDSRQAILCFILIAILNLVVKFANLSEAPMLAFYLLEIFLVGCLYNLWFLIMQTRVAPEFQSINFEFNYCLACLSNTIGPII